MHKLVLFTILLVSLLLAACGAKQADIAIESTKFDFGDVVNGVIVSRDLTVRNTGESDLVVGSVVTTCGCTSATLEPMTIPAGSEAALHISFDSGAHGPHLTGEVMRRVIISSNDPDTPEATVDFVANILAPESQ